MPFIAQPVLMFYYPGSNEAMYREYHELLPGLGAFALRPTDNGEAAGKLPLKRFIEEVLDHTASQITQHERGRYWIKEVYDEQDYFSSKPPAASFLSQPPADTQVLLGFVKNIDQWKWIKSNERYNLRGGKRQGSVGLGSKELACDLIILSCPANNLTRLARVVGLPELHSEKQMEESGYPQPNGIYYCYCLEFLNNEYWDDYFESEMIENIRSSLNPVEGHPVVLSWLSLVNSMETSSKKNGL